LGGKFFYPCVKCVNGRCHSVNEIRSHLICHEIVPNYTKWIWHGELPTICRTKPIDEDIGDRIEDMICDLGQDCFYQAHAPLYEKIESDSKKPLYEGCTSFNYKVVSGVSFGELEGKIWVEWQKLHWIPCVIEEDASRRKHIVEKSVRDEEDFMSCGNGVQENPCMP